MKGHNSRSLDEDSFISGDSYNFSLNSSSLNGTTDNDIPFMSPNLRNKSDAMEAVGNEEGTMATEKSPSTETDRSGSPTIFAWSEEGLSPKTLTQQENSCNYETDDDDEANDRSDNQYTRAVAALLDDDSSKDFEVESHSHASYDSGLPLITRDSLALRLESQGHNLRISTPSFSTVDILPPPYQIKGTEERSQSSKVSHKLLPQTACKTVRQAGLSVTRSSSIENKDSSLAYSASQSSLKPMNSSPIDIVNIPMTESERKEIQSSINSENKMKKEESERVPTLLQLAASTTATIADFRQAIAAHGLEASYQRDVNGRFPIHVLSSNARLLMRFAQESFLNRPGSPYEPYHIKHDINELEDLIYDLVKMNPESVVTPDIDGKIPFMYAIEEFITYSARYENNPVDQHTLETARISPHRSAGYEDEGLSAITSLEDKNQRNLSSRHKQADSDVEMGKKSSNTASIGANVLERLKSNDSHNNGRHKSPMSFSSLLRNMNFFDDNSDDASTRSKKSIFTSLSNAASIQSVYMSGKKCATQSTRALYRDTIMETKIGYNNTSHLSTPLRKNVAKDSCLDMDGVSYDAYPSMRKHDLPEIDHSNTMSTRGYVFQNFVPFYVEWSLQMISNILILLERIKTICDGDIPTVHYRSKIDSIRATLIHSVCSCPLLMKTLLIIKASDPAKKRIFCFPLFTEMISSKDTVGSWIVYMLEAVDKNVATAGVDYLDLLSTVPRTSKTTATSFVSYLEEDKIIGLFDKVASLDFLLPASLSMEDREDVNRASATLVIRYVVDKELRQGGSMVVAFLDLFFCVMLLVTFQIHTNYHLYHGAESLQYIVTFYCMLTSILYGMVRVISFMISMVKISMKTYQFICGGILDWAERIALGMALTSIVWIDILSHDSKTGTTSTSLRFFLASTTFLLWLRIMVWLSRVNNSANVFFLAIRKIIIDLRWLWLSLVCTILAFSQMFLIATSVNGQCHDGGFCDPKDVYLQSFVVMLGQYNQLDFPNVFTTVIFVIFTVIVCIILFHTLTAITVQSYRTSSENFEFVHGNCSRLAYAVEVRALRRLFITQWTVLRYLSFSLFFGSSGLLLFLSNIEPRNFIIDTFGKQTLYGSLTVLSLIVFLSSIGFLSQITYFDWDESSISTSWKTSSGESKICWWTRITNYIFYPFRYLLISLLDLRTDTYFTKDRNGEKNDRIVKQEHSSKVRDFSINSQDRQQRAVLHHMQEVEEQLTSESNDIRCTVLHEIRSREASIQKMFVDIQNLLLHQSKMIAKLNLQSELASENDPKNEI